MCIETVALIGSRYMHIQQLSDDENKWCDELQNVGCPGNVQRGPGLAAVPWEPNATDHSAGQTAGAALLSVSDQEEGHRN